MKKLALLIAVLLALSLLCACGAPAESTTASTSTEEIENTKRLPDPHIERPPVDPRFAFTVEKTPENKVEDDHLSAFTIVGIERDCFYGENSAGSGTLLVRFLDPDHVLNQSEEFCIGDIVLTMQTDFYISGAFGEATLLSVTPMPVVTPDIGAIAYKPVIYLYPETETEVRVSLTLDGKLTCTYPAYEDGWDVVASPDGTLTDRGGQTYRYLYWEGETSAVYDFSEGFCVAGRDTAAFLETALDALGLTRAEANEFIVFWLPLMQENPYNLISFQTDAYTESAVLSVEPAPDTLLRVFMAWKPLGEAVEIAPQTLTAPAREGFTVVEWGGSIVK